MKILLVDDHVIVRTGLRNLLTSVFETQISEAATGRDAMLILRRDRPYLVLLDLNLPGVGGLELLCRMLQEDKTVRILVLSMHTEALYAARAMDLGARGYVSKNASAEELLTAVRRVSEGGRYIENEIAQELALNKVSITHGLRDLTERDLEIMRLLAEGMNLTEIADALGVGCKTVANGCSQIKARLGVTRTNELVRLAMTLGVTRPACFQGRTLHGGRLALPYVSPCRAGSHQCTLAIFSGSFSERVNDFDTAGFGI